MARIKQALMYISGQNGFSLFCFQPSHFPKTFDPPKIISIEEGWKRDRMNMERDFRAAVSRFEQELIS